MLCQGFLESADSGDVEIVRDVEIDREFCSDYMKCAELDY